MHIEELREIFYTIFWILIYVGISWKLLTLVARDIMTTIPPLTAQIKSLWHKPASSAQFSVWQRNEGTYLICLRCGVACADGATALAHTHEFHRDTENVQG